MNSLFFHKKRREAPRVSGSFFIVSNRHSFRRVSRRPVHLLSEGLAEDVVIENLQVVGAGPSLKLHKTKQKKAVEVNETNTDESKRLFLRLAGVAGLGIVAATVLPKKAEALVMGSSPQAQVLGLKNAAGTRIDPATETTLAAMKAKTDLLTFDSGTGPANLQVRISAGNVGVQNVAAAQINPATEDTLALIQLQTNKLTFDGSNNLLTSVGGSGSIVGVKDTTGTQVNPATDDSLVYLRRMVKLMESQATTDAANRQRVVVDSFGTGIVTGVGASGAGVPRVTVSTDSAFSATITSFLGAGNQAFQDVARNTYANGVRANLLFS